MRQSSIITKTSLSKYKKAREQSVTDNCRKLEASRQIKIDAQKRQLDAAQQEAAAAVESLRMENTAKEAELQRQIDYVRKTAEAEAARVQRRAEAEMADLRATISRLEVDLMKVCVVVYI
jgi:uncharacterized membrane protein YqiK